MKKLLCVLILPVLLFCTGAGYPDADSYSENKFDITFSDSVDKITEGKEFIDIDSIWEKIKSGFLTEIKEALVTFTTVFSVVILFSVVSAMQQGIGRQGVSEVAFFAVYCVVCVILLEDFTVFYKVAVSVIDSITLFLNSAIPIVGTAMVSSGGFGAYSAMTPVIIAASSIGVNLIKGIGIPAMMMSMSLGIVGSLSKDFSLSQIGKTIRGAVLWIISGVLSIFCALIGISGIGAGGFNVALMRGVKIVASSMIPILGSILSESAEAVMTGGVLLKNAVGTAALLCMILMVIYPVLKVCAATLVYKVLAAIISPFADSRICSLINDVSGVLSCFLGFIAAQAVVTSVAILSLVSFKGVV